MKKIGKLVILALFLSLLAGPGLIAPTQVKARGGGSHEAGEDHDRGRGRDDSGLEQRRGRGQDDRRLELEKRRDRGRRGAHHLEDEDHRDRDRGRGADDSK